MLTVARSADAMLHGHLAFLREHGFEVFVICSPGEEVRRLQEREGVEVIEIPIARDIDLLRDLEAFVRLFGSLRKLRPEIVNASTPKAGLLGMLAAFCNRVPLRVYLLRGLRFETTRGLRRSLLRLMEGLAAACAHQVVAISPSLREAFVAYAIAHAQKVSVFGHGSSNGIEFARFSRTEENLSRARALRKELEIPEDARIIGYVGRLTKDKGSGELLSTLEAVREEVANCYLLIVGEFEDVDPIPSAFQRDLAMHPYVRLCGYVPDTAAYFHMMDVFVFPSRREGLGNAILEASAAQVPVVGYRVTGVMDAICDGKTGRLLDPGAQDAMVEAIVAYLKDPLLSAMHGEKGARWVEEYFAREPLWQEWLDFYRKKGRRSGP